MVIDHLMRAGWPALEEVHVDGWLARFAGGVTQRANSVLPLATPTDLPDALTQVEALYADRGQPAIFQLGPNSTALDEFLAERGYKLGSPTSIQTTNLDETTLPPSVAITETPDQNWLDLWWSVDGRGDAEALAIAVKILTGGPALYATIIDERGAAAIGRLALVGEWGGVYCMAVRPDVRRRSLGATVLAGLHAAGHQHGVTRTWLHVLTSNTAARQLYARHGYEEISTYHYRTQPNRP